MAEMMSKLFNNESNESKDSNKNASQGEKAIKQRSSKKKSS